MLVTNLLYSCFRIVSHCLKPREKLLKLFVEDKKKPVLLVQVFTIKCSC